MTTLDKQEESIGEEGNELKSFDYPGKFQSPNIAKFNSMIH